MKKIEELKIDVIHFSNEDIIATSTPTDFNNSYTGDYV